MSALVREIFGLALVSTTPGTCYQNTLFTFPPSGSNGPTRLLIRNWMHLNSSDPGPARGNGNDCYPHSRAGKSEQGWQFVSFLHNPG